MVRHECAEALGAIGAARSLPLLERLSSPDAEHGHPVEIEQTCRVATDFCRWKASGGEARGEAAPGVACACMLSPYASHDPAPPDPATEGMSTAEVGAVLCDESRPLFERYGAMFALRNRGGADAVRELGRSLVTDASSALLRHEVAFVLGQMQHSAALDALAEALMRPAEHSMVRHEAAEALGALEFDDDDAAADENVAGDGECRGVAKGNNGAERRRLLLERHSSEAFEPDSVVRESCEVALDATDYWATLGAVNSSDGSVPLVEGGAQFGDSGSGGGQGGPVGFKAMKTNLEVKRAHFNIK
jgi:deoxyhypusine monooxygenase